MKLATMAAVLGVAALLFFAFGCTSAPIAPGGTPSPTDRILATRYGAHAVDLIAEENFGQMVCVLNNKTTSIDLSEVQDKTRLIPEDHSLIKKARRIGTCFGDLMP